MAFRSLRSSRTIGSSVDGNVMLEFALALPVLCLMLVGMIDLGRYGLQRAAMLEGARAGAEYGVFVVSTQSLTTLSSGNSTAINTTAQNATALTGVTATSSLFCECVAGTSTSCTTTCGSGQTLKKYVTVSATKSFTSILARSTLSFGGAGSWTPPTSLSASMTMIAP
jgi:Flp pilus assembly protein TadG